MELPKGVSLKEQTTDERNKSIGTTFVGDGKYSGKVSLDMSNGNLFIQ